jgi:ABC-type Zn2+ transport system substrate-binding protein/surface adhesin
MCRELDDNKITSVTSIASLDGLINKHDHCDRDNHKNDSEEHLGCDHLDPDDPQTNNGHHHKPFSSTFLDSDDDLFRAPTTATSLSNSTGSSGSGAQGSRGDSSSSYA